ncbi:MAG: Uncharacterized protein CEN90_61 [Parcubacteria group bacterium Licking1014_17]|nr:MAG: Uncharacterized protein CEN90_61 [Parcubacteria group bacterium Licking1014_17]
MDPVKIELDVFAGQAASREITITNQNPFAVTISPEVMNFKVSENSEIHWYIGAISDPLRSSAWLEVDEKSFVLKSGEAKRVGVSVAIPADTQPGGRYATVFFNSKPVDAQNKNADVRAGTMVIINVPGAISKAGNIVGFNSPLFVIGGPLDFIVKFANTGKTHYNTKATLKISNLFWNVANISSDQKFLYPDVIREIPIKWNTASLFGIYTAQLSVTDGQGVVHTAEKHFVGVSIKYLALLIALGFIAWFGRKKLLARKSSA